MKLSFCLVSSFLFLNISWAGSFSFPENNLWIPADIKADSKIDQTAFINIINSVTELYREEMKNKGLSPFIEKAWNDGTVNAWTDLQPPILAFKFFGGMARHPLMTKDGYTLTVCHEFFHYFGGAPKKNNYSEINWSSIEGQTDYVAALKCLRRLFEKQDNVTEAKSLIIPSVVTQKCTQHYSDANKIAICQRTVLAGLSLAGVLADISIVDFSNRSAVNLLTPDTNVVRATSETHPGAQCRLDTIFRAALCEVETSIGLSDTDPFVGTCKEGEGSRPLCWFSPPEGTKTVSHISPDLVAQESQTADSMKCNQFSPDAECDGLVLAMDMKIIVDRPLSPKDCVSFCLEKMKKLNVQTTACCQYVQSSSSFIRCNLTDGKMTRIPDERSGAAMCGP